MKKIKKRFSLKKNIVSVSRKEMKESKNSGLSKFSKVDSSSQLKKKKMDKNDLYLFKKKEKYPDSFTKVEANIEKWHNQ